MKLQFLHQPFLKSAHLRARCKNRTKNCKPKSLLCHIFFCFLSLHIKRMVIDERVMIFRIFTPLQMPKRLFLLPDTLFCLLRKQSNFVWKFCRVIYLHALQVLLSAALACNSKETRLTLLRKTEGRDFCFRVQKPKFSNFQLVGNIEVCGEKSNVCTVM